MYQRIGNIPKACPYVMAWFCMGRFFGEKRKNSHRFFGIFIRLNLCEINCLLFESCSALSNFLFDNQGDEGGDIGYVDGAVGVDVAGGVGV